MKRKIDPAVKELIDAAMTDNRDKIFDILKDNRQIVDAVDSDGRSALIHVSISGGINSAEVLLAYDANPNLQDKDGLSALHYVAQNFHPEIASLLISNNAEVDIVDVHGNTPLFKAVFNSRGRPEVIKLLLSAGANQDKLNKHGNSPKLLAKNIANFNVIDFLN